VANRFSNFSKGHSASAAMRAINEGVRSVLGQCSPNLRGQVWRECGLHETHFFAYLRGKDDHLSIAAVDAICAKMGIEISVRVVGFSKCGFGSGVASKSKAKWDAVDWTKNDTQISVEEKVSNERVRQVREALGKPGSPHKWGKGIKKNGNP
jgi:hypothetical protein